MRILITGATSGIGNQLALDYHGSDNEIWVIGRKEKPLKKLAEMGMHTGQIDLTNREQSQQLFATIPPIDLAILNAGTCEYIDMPNFDSKLLTRVMRANVESLAISLEGVLPLLRSGEGRHLAVMGSSAAYLPLPRAEAYGASKAAVAYLVETLRITLTKEEINVSLICPGFVETPLTELNDFPMPFKISTKQASRAIQKGLKNRKAEIHFPKRFTYILKAMALLPRPIWQRLAKKMVQL